MGSWVWGITFAVEPQLSVTEAVDVAYQRRWIGRALISRTHATAGLHPTLVLLAAPKAASYCPQSACSRTRPVGSSRGRRQAPERIPAVVYAAWS